MNDAVRDGAKLEVVAVHGAIVEQKHGCFAAGEELLEGKQLSTVAHDVGREETKLRQRIDHEPRGPDVIDHPGQAFDRRGQLDLAGMEDGVLLLRREAGFGGGELRDGNLSRVPAVGTHRPFELGAWLG